MVTKMGNDLYCKILIIDDEYIMRQGIKHMIEWEKEGYQIVGEATNGEEGLQMVEQLEPDIIFADIVMPKIDGIEFSAIMNKRFPQTRLIMLSSFDKFEYVKQTLLNGAADYVLKPSLNPEVLLNVLEKTVKTIPGMHLHKDTELSMREKLNRYLNGYEAGITEGDWGAHFPYTRYRLLCSKIGFSRDGKRAEEAQILRMMAEFWQEQPDYVSEVLWIKEEICCVLLNYRIKDEQPLRALAKSCVGKIDRHHPGTFWVYGEAFVGLAGMRESYQHTSEETGLRFYYKNIPLLWEELRKERRKPERFAYEAYSELLKYRDFKVAIAKLSAYVDYMCECCVEEYFLKNTVKNLIYNFLLEKESAENSVRENPGKKAEYFREIDHCQYLEEFHQIFAGIMEALSRESGSAEKQNENISEIRQFILQHYSENLELSQLAEQFNYNYNYLSTYFNQQMKESFSEYLNRIRIEKSCEIMKSSPYSIAQVSAMVGYSDPSYFCRIFKSQIGRTPSQWKRMIGKSPSRGSAESSGKSSSHGSAESSGKTL